jgi:phenylacetate-CoA ligase
VIFQPEFESLERPLLERLQMERLGSLVDRLRRDCPPYARRLDGVAAPASPAEIRSLPFTRKSDLRDAYPLGMLAVPQERLARVHASSGTTGNPTVAAYTQNDLAVWADVAARSLAAGGLSPGDMFQVMWGYGLFTGGLGMHGGAERLGLCVIPASSGNTARQLQLLEALPVAGIGATPSYALLIAERLAAEGRRAASLRFAICGAEAWTYEMRAQIEEQLGVVCTNIYGLTEIIGPGVSQECTEAKDGLHIQEDHFLAEIVDPQTGEPLPDGARGELVITTLTREAMPVLRYRTGDLTSIVREPCRCGRTTARMAWITGRVDDMITVRGVNVFPTAIEEVLLRHAELAPHYRIFVDRPSAGMDALLIEVEHLPGALLGNMTDFTEALRRRLHDALAVGVDVRIVAPGAIERVEVGKARRVYDRRNLR